VHCAAVVNLNLVLLWIMADCKAQVRHTGHAEAAFPGEGKTCKLIVRLFILRVFCLNLQWFVDLQCLQM